MGVRDHSRARVGSRVQLGHDRERVGELHLVSIEGGRRGDDLEGGAGRAQQRDGLSGEGAHLAVAGVEDRDAAAAPGERSHGDLLQVRIDRGPDSLARLLLGARQRPSLDAARDVGQVGPLRHGEQLASRPSGEAVVEGQLEAADAGCLVARVARLLQLGCALFVRLPDLARHVYGGASERGVAVAVALGERRLAVLRQDRRSRPKRQAPAEALAGPEVGEGQVRGPGDLLVLDGQQQGALDHPECLGAHVNGHLDDVGPVHRRGLLRVAGADRLRRGGVLGLPVVGGELLDGVLRLRLRGELGVHRVEVLARPRLDEALRRVLLCRPGGRDRTEDERGQGQHPERQGSPAQPAAALAERIAALGGPVAGRSGPLRRAVGPVAPAAASHRGPCVRGNHGRKVVGAPIRRRNGHVARLVSFRS